MAKVEMNAITQHFRGKLGDVVFKRLAGMLIASLRPKPFTGPPSPGQLGVRVLFRKGVNYARAALANPIIRAVYERVAIARSKPVFSTAVGDFFRSPTVDDIDLSLYQGKVGDKIHVLAADDVEVVSVQVVIRNQAGAIAEQAAAMLVGGKWVYTATTALPAGQPATVEVTAKDRPGNTGTSQKAYVP